MMYYIRTIWRIWWIQTFHQIILMQNGSRDKVLNQFGPLTSRDDLCLLFCLSFFYSMVQSVVYWLLGIGWFHAHNSWTIQIQNLERTSLRRLNPAPRKSKSQTPQPGPSKEQVSDASTRPLKRTSLRRLNPAPRMTWSIQESVQNRKTHSSHSKDQRFWDQISF